MQEFIKLVGQLKRGSPFSETDAIMDILTMADEKGEISTTRRELMSRWKWSSSKVISFLALLEEKTIIEPKKNQKRTKIKLINTVFAEVERTKKEPKKNQKRTNEKEEDTEIYKRIIERLNMVCGTNYRHNTESSRKDIRARLNEEYKEDDFYIVIDKKAKEWMGTEQEKFLRPMTLFGTKFESYLNQNIVKEQKRSEIDILDEWRNS